MGKTRKKSTASKTVLKFDEELRSTYLAAHSQQKRKSKKEKNKQKKETKIVKNKVEPPKSNSKRTFNISEREETEETNSETIKLPNHVVTITHLFQGASNANDEDERTELDEESPSLENNGDLSNKKKKNHQAANKYQRQKKLRKKKMMDKRKSYKSEKTKRTKQKRKGNSRKR